MMHMGDSPRTIASSGRQCQCQHGICTTGCEDSGDDTPVAALHEMMASGEVEAQPEASMWCAPRLSIGGRGSQRRAPSAIGLRLTHSTGCLVSSNAVQPTRIMINWELGEAHGQKRG
jgi:hypothetical protein